MKKKQSVHPFLPKMTTTFLAVMLLLLACLASQSVKAQADQTDTQARNLGLDSQTAILQILDYGTISVVKGGQPEYLRNQSYVGLSPVWENGYIVDVVKKYTGWTQVEGSADNWNIKFVWPADGIPTLTLKDAKLDNVDDEGEIFCISTVDVSTGKVQYMSNMARTGIAPALGSRNLSFQLEIVLQGDNRIEADHAIIQGESFATNCLGDITIRGENGGKLTAMSERGISNGKKSLNVENATLHITTKNLGNWASIPLWTEVGDIVIKNSNVTAHNEKAMAIAVSSRGNITIQDSTVDVSSKMTIEKGQEQSSGAIHTPRGKVEILNSKVNIQAVNNTGIRASSLVSITDSHVQIKAVGYGIYARDIGSTGSHTDGKIQIGGGSLFITARSGAFWNAPQIYLKGLAGEVEDEAVAYDDTMYLAKWLQMYENTADAPHRIVVSYNEADIVAYNTEVMVVCNSGANIWNKPYSTAGSTRIRTVNKAAWLMVVGKVVNSAGSTWYKLDDGNWIYSGTVEIVAIEPGLENLEKTSYIITKRDASLWTEPRWGGDSRTIVDVNKGEKLNVIAKCSAGGDGLWYKLLDGGWIRFNDVAEAVVYPATAPVTKPTVVPSQEASKETVGKPAGPVTAPTAAPIQGTSGQTIGKPPMTKPTGSPGTKPAETSVTEVTEKPTIETTAEPSTEGTVAPTEFVTETLTQSTESSVAERPRDDELSREKKGSGIKWVIVTVVVIVLIGAGDAAFIIIKKKKK